MKKKMIQIAFPVVFVLFACGPCFAIGPGDLQDLLGLTPADLASQLVGAGNVAPPPLSPPVFTGSRSGAGTFTNGLIDGLGINGGVILSTGDIFNAVGPNVNPSAGLDNVQVGSPALDLLIAPQITTDASTLEFNFIPPPNVTSVTFKYVFASEEYPENVATGFNDVFGLFMDGQNVALIPGTTTPIFINSLNATATPSLFNNNFAATFGTQFDGFSAVLTATVPVTPGTPRLITLAIADGTDRLGDSAVFVAPVTFTGFFDDVPLAHFAFQQILSISNAGITAGCSATPPAFCPDSSLTRAEMAVFIETSLGRIPAPCVGTFADVPTTHPFCGFIELLANDGITGGCGGQNFCPNDPVTRGQSAVFLEAALGGIPAPCVGTFVDVPTTHPFCGFIELLANDGITGGCGGQNFCPNDPVTRGQMAVFLVAAPAPLNP
jgi:hypothetical protein